MPRAGLGKRIDALHPMLFLLMICLHNNIIYYVELVNNLSLQFTSPICIVHG